MKCHKKEIIIIEIEREELTSFMNDMKNAIGDLASQFISDENVELFKKLNQLTKEND